MHHLSQGNCTSKSGLLTASQRDVPLKAGQCELLSPFDLFYWRKYSEANVWLDNLALRLERNSTVNDTTMVYWQQDQKGGGSSRLWLTGLTLQGDGKDLCRGLWMRGGAVYMAGARCSAFCVCVSSQQASGASALVLCSLQCSSVVAS
jgi:hypothetical protein